MAVASARSPPIPRACARAMMACWVDAIPCSTPLMRGGQVARFWAALKEIEVDLHITGAFSFRDVGGVVHGGLSAGRTYARYIVSCGIHVFLVDGPPKEKFREKRQSVRHHHVEI